MQTHAQHGNKMMAAMHTMMDEMSNASMHGDSDNHFARMMQLHHVGTLEMATLVETEGRDEMLKEFARQMKQKQKEEIAALQVFLNNHRPMPHTENAGFNSAMKKLMDNMELNASQEPLNDDPDHDFAALMVHHHQAAIDMADLLIAQGTEPELKKMAGMMKADQETEIQALQKWLNDRRAGSHSH